MATKFLYGPSQASYKVSRSAVAVAIAAAVAVGTPAKLNIVGIHSDASADHVDLTAEPYDSVGTPRLVRALVGFAPAPPADGVEPEDFLGSPGVFVGHAQVDGDGTVEQAFTVDVHDVPEAEYFVQVVLEVTTPDA